MYKYRIRIRFIAKYDFTYKEFDLVYWCVTINIQNVIKMKASTAGQKHKLNIKYTIRISKNIIKIKRQYVQYVI